MLFDGEFERSDSILIQVPTYFYLTYDRLRNAAVTQYTTYDRNMIFFAYSDCPELRDETGDAYAIENGDKVLAQQVYNACGDVMTAWLGESSLKNWIRVWLCFLMLGCLCPLAFLPHPFAITNLVGMVVILVGNGRELIRVRGLNKNMVSASCVSISRTVYNMDRFSLRHGVFTSLGVAALSRLGPCYDCQYPALIHKCHWRSSDLGTGYTLYLPTGSFYLPQLQYGCIDR